MKEETRQKFLAQLESLTPAQKEKLSQACWTTLSQGYFAKLKFQQEKILAEVREEKRKFDKKDFEDLEKKLTQEFAQKLKSAETEEQIQGVRAKLRQFFSAKN